MEPQAKTRARLEPRRGPKRESTQPDLEEEVEETTFTVLVVGGTALFEEGSSSSADVPGCSCVAVSVSVEDLFQTISPLRRKLRCNFPVLVELDRCASMKAELETSRN